VDIWDDNEEIVSRNLKKIIKYKFSCLINLKIISFPQKANIYWDTVPKRNNIRTQKKHRILTQLITIDNPFD